MAIKVNGTTVINDSRALTNVASVDATTATAIGAAGVGGATVYLGETTLSSNTLYLDITLATGYRIHIIECKFAVVQPSPDGGYGGDIDGRMFNSSNSLITSTDYIVPSNSSTGGSRHEWWDPLFKPNGQNDTTVYAYSAVTLYNALESSVCTGLSVLQAGRQAETGTDGAYGYQNIGGMYAAQANPKVRLYSSFASSRGSTIKSGSKYKIWGIK